MSGRIKKRRVDATGRNPDMVGSEGRYLSLRRSIWHSPQVSALSCNGRALMIELLSMFNGSNVDAIFLSVRDAMGRLGFADHHVAGRAFRELEALSLITNTVAGSFRIKTGRGSLARAWRLNWLDKDGSRVGPDVLRPLDMAKLDAAAKARLTRRQTVLKRFTKDLAKQSFSVVDSTMRPPISAFGPDSMVVDSTTRSSENGGNALESDVVESTTHILYQGGRGPGIALPPRNPCSTRLALIRKFGASLPIGSHVSVPQVGDGLTRVRRIRDSQQ